jgi:DNA anti-recombination protein RmuC
MGHRPWLFLAGGFSCWAFWIRIITEVNPMPTTTTATARQALADATAQAQLISQQLAAVSEALHGAEVGTDAHVALSTRAVTLRSQIRQLEASITALAEQAKTEQERQEEQAALAAEASLALAQRMAEHRALVEATITAINTASDHLAALLATAAEAIPPVVEELQRHSGYRITGFESILPLPFSGNGRIGPIPYVAATPNGARLVTRYDARKHLG